MTDRELAGCALLPCPFCGGEAKRDDRTEYQSYSASESQSMGMGVSAGGFSSTTYAIQCGCGIRVQGNNDAFLIERWNRRTPSSEGDAVEHLTESEKDVALGQAVEFAEYVERQAKGAMRDAAKRFLSLPYSQEIAERLAAAPTVSAEGEATDA